MPRDLCAVAKLGRRCWDDLCRGGSETLCGFDEDLWEDLTTDAEDYFHQDEDGGE